MASELAKLLHRRFFFGHTRYAVMSRTSSGEIRYTPVDEEPTPEIVQQHLDREITIGAYSLDNQSRVNLIAFDVDGTRESTRVQVENIAQEIYRVLVEEHGLRPVLEFSGNKGYHVLLLLEEPMAASAAKTWADRLADSLALERRPTADPHVEIFPKQDILLGERIGNLLKLPLGLHLKTRSMSYLCNAELQEVRSPVEELLNVISPSQLAISGATGSPFDIMVGLIGPKMGPGARHLTWLNVCGYLVRQLWSETDVNTLLDELDAQFGPFDIENLRELTSRTFRRFENQESIVFSLRDLELTVEELEALERAASAVSTDPTLLSANKILGLKGMTPLQKGRALSDLIRSHMAHQGEVCQDDDYNLYWLLSSSGKLYSSRDSRSWNEMLFNMVRYNSRDTIFRLAEEDLRMSLYQQAPTRVVKRLAHWDPSARKLFLNLGGPWVYILNGEPAQRRAVYNGENLPVLFDNSEESHNFPNLLTSGIAPIQPWSMLLDDVSFSDLEAISARESKELLKVWLVSVLFSSMMATRPLLAILARPGAGKTTLARRIVRFFGGPQVDVLSVLSDKPDSLRAQIVSHKVLCLDNLERSGSRWMADDLNRASTGASIEMRQLYTTNTMTRYRPDVFIVLTATEMPFTEETVFSRMLPVPLAQIENPTPESELQSALAEHMAGLWLGMFDLLDEAILVLQRNADVQPLSTNRLADFTHFAARLQGFQGVDWPILRSALQNLTASQQTIEAAHSPTLRLLRVFAQESPEEAANWHTAEELLLRLRDLAGRQRPRLPCPTTADVIERDCRLLGSQLQALDFVAEVRPGRSGISTLQVCYTGAGSTTPAVNGHVNLGSGRSVSYTSLIPEDGT